MRAWVLFACLLFAAPGVALAEPDVVIRDVTVLDPATGVERAHMTVVVRGDRITRVDPAAEVPAMSGDIDGRGRYLLPGLNDAHAHMVNLTPDAFPLLIALGVTSVRDMGGDPVETAAWRDEIEQGARVGPRIKFCGWMLESPGDVFSVGHPNHVVVDGPAEAQRIVGELAEAGVDCIKMRTVKDMETYVALADAARAAHLPLVGHPPYQLDPVEVARAGQQTFEHAFYPYPFGSLADERRAEIIAALRTSGVRLTPSFVVWAHSMLPPTEVAAEFRSLDANTAPARFISPSLYGNWVEGMEGFEKAPRGSPGWIRAVQQAGRDFAEMHRAGIGVVAGTDLGAPFVDPATALYQELELMVALGGLTPAEAVSAATWDAAALFDQQDRFGSITVGKAADLILLDANPFADIANIRTVNTVIARGVVYGPDDRRRMTDAVIPALARQWRDHPPAPMPAPE